jgi:hypothetical protein
MYMFLLLFLLFIATHIPFWVGVENTHMQAHFYFYLLYPIINTTVRS